ncbi:hypothetical protein FRC08_013867 [Ceratobasidium sp. 394]|nr:hypothetical protein FRC08_013867 [Ceratobasidium sp. 394]
MAYAGYTHSSAALVTAHYFYLPIAKCDVQCQSMGYFSTASFCDSPSNTSAPPPQKVLALTRSIRTPTNFI